IIRLLSSVPGPIELLTGSGSQLLKDTLKRRVYGRDREKNRFSVTGSAAIMLARRTLYWEYNVPVKIGMSPHRFGSAREMSDTQSKKRRWFSYKSGYNRESSA